MEHFSEREYQIIKIINKKSMTLEQISVSLFHGKLYPMDSNIAVANSVRRIIKKCDHYNLKWTLVKTRINNKLTIKRGRR